MGGSLYDSIWVAAGSSGFGRGRISEVRGTSVWSGIKEKEIVRTWEANRGHGPGHLKGKRRGDEVTISIRTVRRVMEANRYPGQKKRGKKHAGGFEVSCPLEMAHMDILEVYILKMKLKQAKSHFLREPKTLSYPLTY